MIFDREGLDPEQAATLLEKAGSPGSISDFKDQIVALNVANSVFVDCTASEEVASVYLPLLEANVSVVTANKIASSSSYGHYRKLKTTAREKGVKFFFETDRKSTRLNSSHVRISYAVFCLKKKKDTY